jgi:hypothetical protein
MSNDSALRLEQKQATLKLHVFSDASEIKTNPGRRECVGLVLIVSHEAWAKPRLHAPLSPSGGCSVQISDALLCPPCTKHDPASLETDPSIRLILNDYRAREYGPFGNSTC